ncbi:hypothetical protein J6590_061764 [Homalodisca vitripennis]|nr:hypothetical protein J6590_061764 [Homalodisca vitripennis]
MEIPEITNQNYVGMLQEKCCKSKISLPNYCDLETDRSNLFKCSCQLGELHTEGVGYSKKAAKQNAAQRMLSKMESTNTSIIGEKQEVVINSVSRLGEYATKNKLDNPLYAEKSEEDGLFVFTCTFNGFTSEGRGHTKKQAKEKSANSVAQHFGVHEYFENLKKCEKRKSLLKPPTQRLHEYCQDKHVTALYSEEKISLANKKEAYVVICKVGDFEQRSLPNESKKLAKLEVASMVLNLLNNDTPGSSPSEERKRKSVKEDLELTEELTNPASKKLKNC